MAVPDEQTMRVQTCDFFTILASKGVEFLLAGDGKASPFVLLAVDGSSDGIKVPFSSLDDKVICLFFSANWCRPCKTFMPQLVDLYNGLRGDGKCIEIVFVSFDRDEDGFEEHFKSMPWLAVPFDVGLNRKLNDVYHVDRIPSVVSLSLDGTLIEDLIGFIEDYGTEAYPFTVKRREELRAIDNAKRKGGKLEQLLSHERRTHMISRDAKMISVSELVGRTVGLYFGAHWCPPSRAFTQQLAEAYNELISTRGHCFEIILVSTDRDHEEFDLNLSTMPWLAIPYEDRTRHDLCRIFNIKGIPALVILGEDGKTIRTDGKAMVSLYGAKAFPFTESRIAEIEAALKKEGDALPQQVNDIKHEHVLKLDMAKAYVCDNCNGQGRFWAFSCDVCDYDLHPACVEQKQ